MIDWSKKLAEATDQYSAMPFMLNEAERLNRLNQQVAEGFALKETELIARLSRQSSICTDLQASISAGNLHSACTDLQASISAGNLHSVCADLQASISAGNLHAACTDIQASISSGNLRAALLGNVLEHGSTMNTVLKYGFANSDESRIDRFSTVRDILSAQEASQRHLAMCDVSAINEARSLAVSAQSSYLHATLAPFRTSVDSFASKLLYLQTLDTIKSPAYLNAFMQASTISDLFAESMRVDRQLQEATRQFSLEAVPTFSALNDYRQFLDASGFRLPHWPHVRLLTIGEKRRRFRARLNNNAEPVHVKKAKSLEHRYQLTLREILDEVMASEYGEDWAVERLPLCDCKDLLGKWQNRGGEVLDHADYFHYERIMSHPEHFETVFEAGFDDRVALSALINKARLLRSRFAHSNPFTQEDLRDLRLIWLTIETGLLALIPNYDIDN